MQLVTYDYAAMARLDLDPLYTKIEEYRTAHNGRYPSRLRDLELNPSYAGFYEDAIYKPPINTPPALSEVLCVLKMEEHKKRRTLLGVKTKIIPHLFALCVDGAIIVLPVAS